MFTIIGKRWFCKSAGNTYHSVVVLKNGERIGYNPFAYGYDDSYLQTALEILQNAGEFQKTGESLPSGMDADMYAFNMALRDRAAYTCIVVDVPRKKDLAQ